VEAKDRAKNESTVEQIETSPANSIMAKMVRSSAQIENNLGELLLELQRRSHFQD